MDSWLNRVNEHSVVQSSQLVLARVAERRRSSRTGTQKVAGWSKRCAALVACCVWMLARSLTAHVSTTHTNDVEVSQCSGDYIKQLVTRNSPSSARVQETFV